MASHSEFIGAGISGKIKIIKRQINEVNQYNLNYALNYATIYGHYKIVKILLQRKIKIKKLNKALLNCTHTGNLKIVKLLIKHGADIYTNDNDLIRWSAYYGYYNIVKYLIILQLSKNDTSFIDIAHDYAKMNHAYDPLPSHVQIIKNTTKYTYKLYKYNPYILI